MSESLYGQWKQAGKSYAAGVALYIAHGHDEAVKACLQQGQSPWRLRKLSKELQRIDGIAPRSSAQLPKNPQPTPGAPEVDLSRYEKEWKPLYAQMNALRHELEHMHPRDRAKACFRILELEQQCMKWWAMADYYQQTGEHITQEEEPEYYNPDMLPYRKRRNVDARSKLKAKLAKDPNNLLLKQKMENLQREYEQLQEQISYYNINGHGN